MDDSYATTTIWLVRHGKTMFNTMGRVQGWSDTPLTPEGQQVVEALAKGLRDVQFDAMYSSDSGRARETLKIIAKQNLSSSIKLQEDWRLREINFGNYEGEVEMVMWQAMAEAEGLSLEQWANSFTPVSYVDGMMQLEHQRMPDNPSWPAESYQQVLNRLLQAFNNIVHSHANGSQILIVMHGGSIAILLDALIGNLPDSTRTLKNASVNKLSYHSDRGFSLLCINDMSYVEAGEQL